MKRRLLMATAACAILFGTIRPSYALFGEGDIVFDPSTYTELVQEAKDGLEQIKWLTDIYDTASDQIKVVTGIWGDTTKTLNQLTSLYNAFAHVTNATQLAQALNTQFIHEPMLTDAIQLEQAFRGLGLTTSLFSKIKLILDRVQYYAPSNNDFAGWHMNKRTTATAGQLTSAEDSYTASTQRVAGLQDLMNGINTDDPKKVSDLTARGTIETASAVAQTNQLLAAGLIQQAQRDSAQQQSEQGFRYSVDQMRIHAQAAIAAAQGGAVNLVTQ